MTSDSLFNNCESCGEAISKKARSCTKCGNKRKISLKLIHWICIGFAIFIVIGIFSSSDNPTQASVANNTDESTSNNDVSTSVSMPKEQDQFITMLSGFSRAMRDTNNELQQSHLRDQRKIAIANLLNSRSLSSWVGRINELKTNGDGNAILTVRISPEVSFKTWNNSFSDIGSMTLIEKSSSLYANLMQLSVGQKVLISGNFFASDIDHIEEQSLTIEGSMREPEFLFKFKSVKSVN